MQMVKNILCGPETRAVIIETYGAGNAPSKEWFSQLVEEANKMGKILVNVTQCLYGQVNMNLYATGGTLKHAGVLSGNDSTTESALGKLFHLMGKYKDNDKNSACSLAAYYCIIHSYWIYAETGR